MLTLEEIDRYAVLAARRGSLDSDSVLRLVTMARDSIAARAELERCREVLRAMEWSGRTAYVSTERTTTLYRVAGIRLKKPRTETVGTSRPTPSCPTCGGARPIYTLSEMERYASEVGHRADCALSAALGGGE